MLFKTKRIGRVRERSRAEEHPRLRGQGYREKQKRRLRRNGLRWRRKSRRTWCHWSQEKKVSRRIPQEEPGGLQSMGSLRVGHDWAASLSLFTFMHWRRKWQPAPVFLPGESQDGGAWWAADCGVAQSRTRLKRLSSSSSSSEWFTESNVGLGYTRWEQRTEHKIQHGGPRCAWEEQVEWWRQKPTGWA